MSEIKEKLLKYPKTELFEVVDTIGVPHPYCIGAKHVAHASDNYSGILGDQAIQNGEENGIYCEICKGKLRYDEHKQALLIACDAESPNAVKDQLQEYLKSIVEMCEDDGYVGFAFTKKEGSSSEP